MQDIHHMGLGMTARRTTDGWGNRNGKMWSPEEINLLLELRHSGEDWDSVAAAFPHRKRFHLQSKYHYLMKHAPARLIVSAEPSRVDGVPLTLTAAICGDPLPGRSALDRREPSTTIQRAA